jgi:hypothetical protein
MALGHTASKAWGAEGGQKEEAVMTVVEELSVGGLEVAAREEEMEVVAQGMAMDLAVMMGLVVPGKRRVAVTVSVKEAVAVEVEEWVAEMVEAMLALVVCKEVETAPVGRVMGMAVEASRGVVMDAVLQSSPPHTAA